MTIAQVIAAYMRHAESVRLFGDETLSERKRVLGKFADTHGNTTIAEARAFILADWIEGNPRWKTSATRKSKANQINAAFNWAAGQGRIDRNPFAGVKYDESEPRQPMQDVDFTRVASLGNKAFERAVRFLRYTGLRLSELCGLDWSDVDFERRIITIRKHKARKRTKKAKVIPLAAEAVELLIQVRHASGETVQSVFCNNRGTRWTRRTLGQQLRRLKIKHKIDTPATLHGLRHQVATIAIARGESPKLVAHLLGHASVQTTERFYCHLEQELEAVRDVASAAIPVSIQTEAKPKSVANNIPQKGVVIVSALTR